MQVAAVLGYPIEHSLSPVLHEAAYQAMGLTDWEYSRISCTAEQLPQVVQQSAPQIRGYSVTMPGKEAALSFADEVTERARLVGSVNTLVRRGDSWFADCTDIDGARAAIAEATSQTGTALIIGAGGTARPYLAACQEMGFQKVDIAARSLQRSHQTLQVGQYLGLQSEWIDLADSPQLTKTATQADLVISTLPADAAAHYCDELKQASRFVDVTYAPWPTTVAHEVLKHGGVVVGGLTMLLNQAITQIEYFTGKTVTPDVVHAMEEALSAL